VCWTTVGQVRSYARDARAFSVVRSESQNRNWSTSRIRHVTSILRNSSRRIHHEGTLFHHSAWSRSERWYALRLFRMAHNLLLRVTAFSRNNGVRLVFRLCCHRSASTTQQATAGHPKRDGGRKNLHCEKRAHSAVEVYSRVVVLSRTTEAPSRSRIVIKTQHFCNR
jgi:hypothetical protein